jgi:hypothetical protein
LLAPAVKPEPVCPRAAGDVSDDEFGAEVEAENPDLLAKLRKIDAERRENDWFSVNMIAIPSSLWTDQKAGGKAPDLGQFADQRALTDHLARLSACEDHHTLKMELEKSQQVEQNARKRFFFKLECTSNQALINIQKIKECRQFKGYTLSFYQPKQQHYGQRFQIPLNDLPMPSKKYSTETWFKVLCSQGWDGKAITHLDFSVRESPGTIKVLKDSMLDIWVILVRLNFSSINKIAVKLTSLELTKTIYTTHPLLGTLSILSGSDGNAELSPTLQLPTTLRVGSDSMASSCNPPRIYDG